MGVCDTTRRLSRTFHVHMTIDTPAHDQAVNKMASGYSACNALLVFLLVGMVQEGNGEPPFSKICHLEGYDVNNLRRPSYIRFDLNDPNICPGEKTEPCDVYLSICQTLPNNTSPEGSCNYYSDENDDVAVCVVVGNHTKDAVGFGDYNTTIDPFHELPVDSQGRTSFEATFYGGSGFSLQCTTTTTTVIFVCDHLADWERYYRKDQHDNIYAVESTYLESSVIDSCILILTVRYDGACKPSSFSGDFGLPIDIGWILIIIAVLLVVIYLVVGSIINVIRGGRTFSTIFPNYNLWLKFLGLVLEGFKMTFDYITCQPCLKKKADYEKM